MTQEQKAMTPEQKATEIIDKFLQIKDSQSKDLGNLMFINEAKECALICVNEIINSKPIGNSINYWLLVKQKIENRKL